MRLVFWSAAFESSLADQAVTVTFVFTCWIGLIWGLIDVFPPYLQPCGWRGTSHQFRICSAQASGLRWWILIAGRQSVISGGVLLWWVSAKDQPGRWGVGCGRLLIGGALGNVGQQCVYGAVADFY